MELAGAIDLHAHSTPDVRPRKTTSLELAQTAKAAGMRGLLLKNHQTSTCGVAATIREMVPDLAVFGGLVLNDATGGFNPAAVESAIRMDARQIWMPTHCAEGERIYRGRPGTGLSIHDGRGKLKREVMEIVRLVAEADIILGTAHLTHAEILDLCKAARDAGVRKILVNHPEIRFVNLPEALQRELLGFGVYFERCYVRAGFAVDWDGLAAVIRAVGIESTVLATDLGQPENPDPVSGLCEMRDQLARRGFPERQLRLMMCETPAHLLGV